MICFYMVPVNKVLLLIEFIVGIALKIPLKGYFFTDTLYSEKLEFEICTKKHKIKVQTKIMLTICLIYVFFNLCIL